MKYTDAELVTLVTTRYQAGLKGRNSCDAMKNNILTFLDNKVVIGNGAKTQPALNVNLIYVAVENLASLMSDTPVSINVTHKKPDTEVDAMVYQAGINWILEQNRINRKRESEQKNSMFFGTGIFSCSVEADMKRQDGTNVIKVDNRDPRGCVLDPLATQRDNINWRIFPSPYSRADLKKLYPEWKGLKAIQDASGNADLLREIDLFNETEQGTSSELFTVYEMIWKDDEDYPNGRYTVCTETEVLEDGPFEYLCWIPDVYIPCISMPDRIIGVDLIRFMKPITDELNIIWKRLSVMIKKCANPQKLVSALAGIDTDNITNADGQVHVVKNLMDVRGAMQWEQPVQITESIFAFVEKLQQMFQIVAGLTDISVGYAQINSNMPSGISLERLQQATQTRLRQMVRNRNDGFVDLGKILAALIHQYMNTDQMIRISGLDAEQIRTVLQKERNQVAKVTASAGAQSPDEIQTGVELYENERGIKLSGTTKDNVYLSFNGSKLVDPCEFDISVSAGLDVPKSKVDIAMATKEMHAAGEVDLESYLESIEHPYKDKILSRSQAWKAFKQFMAMQQQAQNAETGRNYGKTLPGSETGSVAPTPGQESPNTPASVPNTPDAGNAVQPNEGVQVA